MGPLLTLAISGVALAQPGPAALRDFQPGAFEARAVGGRDSRSHCLTAPEGLLAGGRAVRGCTFTLVESAGDRATYTYRCPTGLQGRSVIQREAQGLYTLDSQGIDESRPFAGRSEWRRTGDC